MLHTYIYLVLNMHVIKISEGKFWSLKHLSAQKTLHPVQRGGNQSRPQVTAARESRPGDPGALAVMDVRVT